MKQPKKSVREEFLQSKDWETVRLNLSEMYLLISMANSLADEADDLLKKHGMAMGEVKWAHNAVIKAIDNYDITFRRYMEEGMKELAMHDYDDLSRISEEELKANESALGVCYFRLRTLVDRFRMAYDEEQKKGETKCSTTTTDQDQ